VAQNVKALQKWNEIPKPIQEKIVNNVYCGNCFVTTIVDFNLTLTTDKLKLPMLEGKCQKCGSEIARVLD